LANKQEGIKEKTKKIQEGDGQLLLKQIDNPTDGLNFKNIKIIDKQNIHNNFLQVINQYETTGNHKNRYDVTILVNGLPLIHIELKKRGIALKEAFNQIERYQRDSF
jgi:type I restriction enzyme R subunit